MLEAREPTLTRFRIEEGEDNGRYTNIDFWTSNRLQLWRAIQSAIYQHPLLGEELMISSMAMCTGADTWNDYLLLHHYDPTISLDTLEGPRTA